MPRRCCGRGAGVDLHLEAAAVLLGAAPALVLQTAAVEAAGGHARLRGAGVVREGAAAASLAMPPRWGGGGQHGVQIIDI